MQYFLISFEKGLKGFTFQPTIHFCRDCGYVSLNLFSFRIAIIFYQYY